MEPETKYQTSIKVPLKDSRGNIIGYCDNFRLDSNFNTVCNIYTDSKEIKGVTSYLRNNLEFYNSSDKPIIVEDSK